MAKGDIGHILKRLDAMSKKSRSKISKSPQLALSELPTARQVRELKRVAREISKTHKTVLQLAATRG